MGFCHHLPVVLMPFLFAASRPRTPAHLSARMTRPAQGRMVWRLLLAMVLVAALAAAVGAALAWRWLDQPLPLAQSPASVSIAPGTSVRTVANLWVEAGVQTSPTWLFQWFRWSGQSRDIRAGNYEVTKPVSPRQLLTMMVRGDEAMERVVLVEGWTFARWRQVLATAPGLVNSTRGWSDAQIMAALGAPGQHPEGRFFPDTYAYAKGNTDLDVMRRAYRAMATQLQAVWQHHQQLSESQRCSLDSPDQALILASIVEKETGHASDRGLVAGVFCNRLRIGMALQTDPTVIYGLGKAFDGNLRRIHLRTDTPYNTYTRGGLPPTPISMPGLAALQMAVQPEPTQALYFVAKGDGTSVFSDNLGDHNRAVNRYQRKRASDANSDDTALIRP